MKNNIQNELQQEEIINSNPTDFGRDFADHGHQQMGLQIDPDDDVDLDLGEADGSGGELVTGDDDDLGA